MTETAKSQALALLTKFRASETPRRDMSFWQENLPQDEMSMRDLAQAFDAIGVQTFNSGDAAKAQDALWPLFMLRLAIVREDHSDRDALRDLATAEDMLGLALVELGNIDPATRMLSEALSYRRGLFQDDPEDSDSAYLYGVSLWHMAQLERAKHDTSSEYDWLYQARDHLVTVDQTWPDLPFIQTTLAEVEARVEELG
jgi:hypothetical protein